MCFLKSPEVGVFDGADISFELPGSTNEGVKSCFIRGNICRICNNSKKKIVAIFVLFSSYLVGVLSSRSVVNII